MSKVIRARNAWAWMGRDKWQGAEDGALAKFMGEINALPQVLRTLSPDEVLVRGMYLMNDQPMHENPYWVRKFDAAAVKQTVPLVAGKPVLVNHTTDGMDGLPVGRFFRAELEERKDGSTWLAALFFMLKDAQGTRLANAIDGGLISENSPTLEFDKVYCSICGEEDLDCDHAQGKLYEGKRCYAVMTEIVDFWEGSLAWAGQQKNTGFYVAAGRDPDTIVTMDDYMAGLAKKRELKAELPPEDSDTYWSGWGSTEH